MKSFPRLSALILAVVFVCGGGATYAAGGPEPLGKFGFWAAYRLTEGEQAVCYMSITAHPPQAKKQKAKRGDVVLMITHRPGDSSTDVVSYTAGLKFKPASEVNIAIGAKKFNLFTQGDTAWSREPATDHALAAAIRSATSMTITGTSAHDTPLADTLNLKGAFAAYVAIGKACGLPVPEEPRAKKAPKTAAKTPKKKNP